MTVLTPRRPRIVWPRCLGCRRALGNATDEYSAAWCPRCDAGSLWLEAGADASGSVSTC